MDKQQTATLKIIDIGDDKAIPDADFCRQFLNDATRRTAGRYDKLGLPYLMVNGEKWRPINAGKGWLASRIQQRNQKPERRHRPRAVR
jgi:hypothetical protein